jgi:pimeloyl-ACP methyl ester carboxylesterase
MVKKRHILAGGALAAVAGALMLRRLGLREDLEWSEVPKRGQLMDIDGYRVHYEDAGAGPTIVMLHGFGGSTYQFRHQLSDLAETHRVVAVDLKGFGYSERGATTGLGADDQVRMLASLLDRLGIQRATFSGNSMGGGIAQRFAVAHPDRVDALVLGGSVDASSGRRPPSLPAPLLRPLLPLLAAFATRRLLRASVYDDSFLTAEVRAEYTRPARIRGSMDGLLNMMQDRARDEPADIASIAAPVMLLWGAGDRVMPLKVAHAIRQKIPHARLVVIDRAGHLLFDEQPEAVNHAILDFLSEATGERAAVRQAEAPA